MKTDNNVYEIGPVPAASREKPSVARVANNLGHHSFYWMTNGHHRAVFDLWRSENLLDDHGLTECVDLYCSALPLDGYAIGNVREFLAGESSWQ